MGYRLDIQLLRAFAVIVVVLYHLGMPYFDKGFLGVDVFFVISGFLMAVLYKEGAPVDFLKRRIRRLLPPYAAVLLATMLVGLSILLPNELTQLNEQSIYSILFAANIGFWNEASYFSSSGFKPLLHLWSLGVEVQYYLFVPLILWFFRKLRLSTLILAIGSFSLCVLILSISPKTSFFMMPLRAWEFLLGAMAGLYFTNNGSVRSASYGWIGAAGVFALVAVQIFPVNGEALGFVFGHPGLAALLTCLATMTVIVFGLPKRVSESNAAKPFVYIGKISYSIYLVHFPIIAFYFYQPFSGTTLSGESYIDAIILLFVIAALSLLCYYLIEKPGPKLNQSYLAAGTITAVAAIVVASGAVITQRFDSYELKFLMANEDRSHYRCGKLSRIMNPGSSTCLLPAESKLSNSVLLLGNSHADSIKVAFNEVASQYNHRTYFVVENNPLMRGGMTIDEIINTATSLKVAKIVAHYSPGAFVPEVYRELYAAAAEKGIELSVISPIPVYDKHIPRFIYSEYQDGRHVEKLKTRLDHLHEIKSTLTVLHDLRTQHPNRFFYYDPSEYLCDESCKVMGVDGAAWYFDSDHLTLTGAAQLVPLFHNIFLKDDLASR